MKVRFKIFRGVFGTWKSLFGEAAEYASQFAPEQLISISHSEDKGDGVVTVWFWGHPYEGDG